VDGCHNSYLKLAIRGIYLRKIKSIVVVVVLSLFVCTRVLSGNIHYSGYSRGSSSTTTELILGEMNLLMGVYSGSVYGDTLVLQQSFATDE
jgi:hypothetical protein